MELWNDDDAAAVPAGVRVGGGGGWAPCLTSLCCVWSDKTRINYPQNADDSTDENNLELIP